MEVGKGGRVARGGEYVGGRGAAPGSWSQAVVERGGRTGRVIAVDLLEIVPVPGVTTIRGDFRDEAVLKRLEDGLAGKKLDLVDSDMAPNLSGLLSTDQARRIGRRRPA